MVDADFFWGGKSYFMLYIFLNEKQALWLTPLPVFKNMEVLFTCFSPGWLRRLGGADLRILVSFFEHRAGVRVVLGLRGFWLVPYMPFRCQAQGLRECTIKLALRKDTFKLLLVGYLQNHASLFTKDTTMEPLIANICMSQE